MEEPPTDTLDGVSPIDTDAELDGIVGVADGPTTVGIGVLVEFGTLVLVGTAVFVGFGTLVFVGTAVFVAVGTAGTLAEFPGKVRAFNSWMLLNPSPSESRFSIDPKAAVFLPLDL